MRCSVGLRQHIDKCVYDIHWTSQLAAFPAVAHCPPPFLFSGASAAMVVPQLQTITTEMEVEVVITAVTGAITTWTTAPSTKVLLSF